MSSSKNITERREAIRAKRILAIQYRLVKSTHKNADRDWHISTTQDMSVVGISFISEVPYNLDDVLEMQMIMSGVIDIYRGRGQVVRVEKRKQAGSFLIAVKLTSGITKKKKSSA